MAKPSVEFYGAFAFVKNTSFWISGIAAIRILLLQFLGPRLNAFAPFTDFPSCIHQIGVIGDVVSVKNASCLMPRDDHGDLLRDAVADHVSDASSPKIMKQQSLVFSLTPA
jgi:hypothetical protein